MDDDVSALAVARATVAALDSTALDGRKIDVALTGNARKSTVLMCGPTARASFQAANSDAELVETAQEGVTYLVEAFDELAGLCEEHVHVNVDDGFSY